MDVRSRRLRFGLLVQSPDLAWSRVPGLLSSLIDFFHFS